MAEITVYTTETEYCRRVTALLATRGLDYSLVTVSSDDERRELVERTGRMSCPVVLVGDEVVGGVAEIFEADRTGRLAALAAR